MIDAMREFGREHDFDVRFDTTIPAGAPTCHFTMWRTERSAAKRPPGKSTRPRSIDKALEIAQRPRENEAIKGAAGNADAGR